MSYNVLRYIMKHQSSQTTRVSSVPRIVDRPRLVLKKKNPSSFFRRLSCHHACPVRRFSVFFRRLSHRDLLVHPQSSPRPRARTNTLARDGSRASRRTRRRRAETGRDRAVGTGAFSRSRGPRSRRKRRVRGKAAPSLFAHTTAFSVDVRARDSPLDPLP